MSDGFFTKDLLLKDGMGYVHTLHRSQSPKTLLASTSTWSLRNRCILVALCCLQRPVHSYPLYHKLSVRFVPSPTDNVVSSSYSFTYHTREHRYSRLYASSLLNTRSNFHPQGGGGTGGGGGDWSTQQNQQQGHFISSSPSFNSQEQESSPMLQHVSPTPLSLNVTLAAAAAVGATSSSLTQSRHSSFISSSSSPDTYRLTMTLQEQVTLTLSLTALFVAFATLILLSGSGAWRFYLAGGICAAISHGITTPIDVIKTRQQVDESLKSMSMYKSTIQIIKQDGLQTLLAGLGPTTFGYLLEGAMKFGIYEVSKPMVGKMLTWTAAYAGMEFLDSKLLGYGICGIIAGIAASVIICPMEAIRIRLVADSHLASNGWILAGFRMIRNEGSHGMWKGLPAMLWKQVPYTVTKNVSFDFITNMAYSTVKSLGYSICGQFKFWIPLIAAMITSILSAFSSQPGDVLLSLVNADEGNVRIRDIFKNIMTTDGIKGFFVGMRARLLHVGTIVTTQLILYDFVKRMCGIAATGL